MVVVPLHQSWASPELKLVQEFQRMCVRVVVVAAAIHDNLPGLVVKLEQLLRYILVVVVIEVFLWQHQDMFAAWRIQAG
ncbi:MAG: hypothetical protein JWM47_4292 [Acidimicrobiales bacterium]|nr:hypothetical protein [Acidimicrobiales bacterium]